MNLLCSWYKRNENKITVFLVVIFFLFITLWLTAIILFIANFYQENDAKYIINLLQIIISWPMMGVVAFLIFITQFKESIEIFLTNHRPKIPGTDERQAEQENKSISETTSDKESLNSNTGSSVKETNAIIDELTNLLEISEFNYLSLFFVDNTKRVLKWFYDLKDNTIITHDSFNSTWQPFILDPNQRETIFAVLQQNGMIQGIPGGAFSITNKGEKFLKFISFIV